MRVIDQHDPRSIRSQVMGIVYDDILGARKNIGDRIFPTPLIRAWSFEERLGRPVYLKCELFQVTGSFKARGALNWLRTASKDELSRGLVSISAGNHAIALAWAAREAGADVKVVMPEASSPMKVEATRAYGAEVILHGDINGAMAKLEEIIRDEGRVLVHPFNDWRVMAGQGTVGLEILDEAPNVSEIWCPVGGGGLISGLAVAVKSQRPDAHVVGVEPANAAAMRKAWDEGKPTRLDNVRTVAASLAPSIVGEHTYAVSREWVDDILTLKEEEIVVAVRAVMGECKLFVEPGAAVGLGALTKYGPVTDDGAIVIVITGGNMDLTLASQLLSSDRSN